MEDSPILVCFAVKEEAKFFMPPLVAGGCERVITGMGRRNAVEGLRRALAARKPRLVITSGFAGGLNPQLPAGRVVFDEDFDAGLTPALLKAGAHSAKFYCAKRVAVTAAEKFELWRSTGADVVEMESAVIRTLCQEAKIPSATIRVISDAAGDDLPLDFNALMTSDDRINFAKLAWQLVRAPGKIPALMKFQEQTVAAARKLADALGSVLRDGRG